MLLLLLRCCRRLILYLLYQFYYVKFVEDNTEMKIISMDDDTLRLFRTEQLAVVHLVTDGNTGKREPFVWTPQMDDAFIQVMLKEQDKGNRVDGTFTSQAYANMKKSPKPLYFKSSDSFLPIFFNLLQSCFLQGPRNPTSAREKIEQFVRIRLLLVMVLR
ncbi:hypothetical protein L6452_28385 [Arctium lappa]|uniref:Uncharacterized protein n=1 Tax=Arctium lappa TaxID=4217 RepID=A0ACB8ZXA2_ARCLA|nr:hypothetical protein L6452_28385 [Arctium lappa]